MEPVYGRDGFSDCRVLCDPENGYWKSCKDQCEGIYSAAPVASSSVPFPVSTTMTTIGTATAPVSLNPSIIMIMANDDHHFPDSNNNVDVHVLVSTMIGTLSALIILLLLYFFRNRLVFLLQYIMRWTRDLVCERLTGPVSEVNDLSAIEMAELKSMKSTVSKQEINERDDAVNENESDTLLNSENKSKGTRTCIDSDSKSEQNVAKFVSACGTSFVGAENDIESFRSSCEKFKSSESGATFVSVPTNDNGSVQYDDGEFHKISHDAVAMNMNNIEKNRSGSESDDALHAGSALAGTRFNKNDMGTVENKGVIRIEIDLR